MPLNLNYSLDALVTSYTEAAAASSSPEHDGLIAVIRELTDAARQAAAQDIERYDHRSLYEFAAALDYTTRSEQD